MSLSQISGWFHEDLELVSYKYGEDHDNEDKALIFLLCFIFEENRKNRELEVEDLKISFQLDFGYVFTRNIYTY